MSSDDDDLEVAPTVPSPDCDRAAVMAAETRTVAGGTKAPEPAGLPTSIGRYQVVGRIGEGGMGVVYEATDPDLKRRVAVKVVRGREGLLREAQAMAQLSHPSVVPVFDVGALPDGDGVFIAMELVEGETLRDWLKAEKRPWKQVVTKLVAAGRGLAAAHAAGVVHRDFKPANVLVGMDGRVRVTDFGLARVDEMVDGAHVKDGETGIAGTPGYVAPEALDGVIDARGDQFAFCVSFYEALYGERPFDAGSGTGRSPLIAMAEEVKRGGVKPAPRGRAVPGWLRAMVVRGLDADPAKRWPSVSAVLDAIERVPRRLRRVTTMALAVVTIGSILGVAAFVFDLRVAGSQLSVDVAAPRPRPAIGLKDVARRLTADPGCEEFPSFTPDGATLLYDASVPDGYAIFAMDVATQASRRLTFNKQGWDFAPAVSPDGKHFAFLRNAPGTAAWVAPISAPEEAREVIAGGFRPTWSRDGLNIWAGDNARPSLVSPIGEVRATVAPPLGLTALIGTETSAGELLAVMVNDGSQSLGLARLRRDGDAITVPGTERRYEEAIASLPGRDSALAVRGSTSGAAVMMEVGFDDSLHELTMGEVQPRTGISVSADGKLIAWSTCQAVSRLSRVVFDAKAGGSIESISGGNWNDRDLAAIPGTTQIVVASDRGGTPELWVVDPIRGETIRKLPSGAVGASGMQVSPDGRWVIYVGGDESIGMGIMVLAVDGSTKPRALTSGPADSSPAFGNDGFVYFDRQVSDERWDVVRVPFVGGEDETVETVVQKAHTPRASEDGAFVVFQFENAPFIRDLATGKNRRLTSETTVAYTSVAFSPENGHVALADAFAINIVERQTGRVVRTIEATGGAQFYWVSYVGDAIIATRRLWEGDLWIGDLDLPPMAAPADVK